jgi:hypothetical protein
MRLFATSIDISASPERVWSVMSDVERWHEWTASITSVETLTAGPLGVGSKARVRQPKLLPAVFDITIWDPPRSFEWVTRSAGVRAVARHSAEPIAGGARAHLSVQFDGVLAPLVAWFAGNLTDRYLEMEAAGLKRRSEAG